MALEAPKRRNRPFVKMRKGRIKTVLQPDNVKDGQEVKLTMVRCENCGNLFETNDPDNILFCSQDCFDDFH